MTPDEIQALREKHQRCTCNYCDHNECRALCGGGYPCDVIKVLDAWEAERSINIGQMLNSYFNAPIYTNEDYDL